MMRDGRDDDGVDLRGLEAGALKGGTSGLGAHRQHGLGFGTPATLGDTGALFDPLRGGVDHGAHFLVGDDPRTAD